MDFLRLLQEMLMVIKAPEEELVP
jgi:hypothetical protein